MSHRTGGPCLAVIHVLLAWRAGAQLHDAVCTQTIPFIQFSKSDPRLPSSFSNTLWSYDPISGPREKILSNTYIRFADTSIWFIVMYSYGHFRSIWKGWIVCTFDIILFRRHLFAFCKKMDCILDKIHLSWRRVVKYILSWLYQCSTISSLNILSSF